MTDGTFGDTEEIGGSDNQGVGGINSGGFSITNLIGGDGLAYFIGVDAAGNQVLWETDGTQGGTKIVNATDGNAPATGISPANMALGPVPSSATDFTGGGKTINLEQVPGEEVDLSNTNNVADTVTGSNGSVNLTAAQAALIGGGLLVNFVAGAGVAVNLSNTKGNKDSVYGSKGTVTLNGAQASVYGPDKNITFAAGTTGNVVYVYDGVGDSITLSGFGTYLTAAPGEITPLSFTLTLNGDVATQTNADGSKEVTTYDITGQAFTTKVLHLCSERPDRLEILRGRDRRREPDVVPISLRRQQSRRHGRFLHRHHRQSLTRPRRSITTARDA